jgi:glycerol-3-phosphate dehydrogenase
MPAPRAQDVDFILEELQRYLSVDVRREDVLSAWYCCLFLTHTQRRRNVKSGAVHVQGRDSAAGAQSEGDEYGVDLARSRRLDVAFRSRHDRRHCSSLH